VQLESRKKRGREEWGEGTRFPFHGETVGSACYKEEGHTLPAIEPMRSIA